MRPAADRGESRATAFTLIELILVMALLVVAFGVSIPTLQRFFRGRTLDSEAHRLLALTRFGQSRATSEGIPMLVWIDPRAGTYGLRPDPAFNLEDPRALEFTLPDDLLIDLPASTNAAAVERKPGDPSPNPLAVSVRPELLTTDLLRGRATVRLLPDGYVSLASPKAIRIRRGEEQPLWLVLNTNRLAYELRSEEWPIFEP